MTTCRQGSVKRVIAAIRSLRRTENPMTTAYGQEIYSAGRLVESVDEYKQVMYDFLHNSNKKVFNVELAPGLRAKLAASLILDAEQRTCEQMEPKTFTLQTRVANVQEIRQANQDFKRYPGTGILSFICSSELEKELKDNPTICC